MPKKPEGIISRRSIRSKAAGNVSEVWENVRRDGRIFFTKEYLQGAISEYRYWAERENDLLLALKQNKNAPVVAIKKVEYESDDKVRVLETWDAGFDLCRWWATPVRYRKDENRSEYSPFAQADEFLKMIRCCLLALRDIHRENFVHCDIQCGNICLEKEIGADGRVTIRYDKTSLIDFAYGIVLNNNNLRLQHPTQIGYSESQPGTENYSRLEREALKHDLNQNKVEKLQQLNYSCDLFSLGKMGQKFFDRLEANANGIQSMGGHIRDRDISNLLERLQEFDLGIPRAYKNRPIGFAHDQIIGDIDKLLRRVNSNPTESVPFYPQPVREEEKVANPSPTPTLNQQKRKSRLSEKKMAPGFGKKPKSNLAWILGVIALTGVMYVGYEDRLLNTLTSLQAKTGVLFPPDPTESKIIYLKDISKKRPSDSLPASKDDEKKMASIRNELEGLFEEVSQSSFWKSTGSGKGNEPAQWDRFVTLLEKAAERGDHDALGTLSQLRHNGKGVKKDLRAALRGYNEVIIGGKASPEILSDVRRRAQVMALTAPIPVELLKDITKFGDNGTPYWQAVLGDIYGSDLLGDIDSVKARSWYQKAASQSGDPEVKQWAKNGLKRLR